MLFLGAVVVTEETWALLYGLGVDGGACADDACRVPLHHESLAGKGAEGGVVLGLLEFACLHVGQCGVALGRLGPVGNLGSVELLYFIGVYFVLPQFVESLPGAYLVGAQLVLVEVVAVDGLGGQCGVAVAFPAAA